MTSCDGFHPNSLKGALSNFTNLTTSSTSDKSSSGGKARYVPTCVRDQVDPGVLSSCHLSNHICSHYGNGKRSSRSACTGAVIEATHLDSNYRYTTLSNETGNYTLAQLREGSYILRATLAGF